MGITRISRQIPAGGTEDILGLSIIDPVEGGALVKVETFHEHGFPATQIKIATQVSSAGSLYPYDGASPVLPSDHGATNGGTSLKLATGAVPVPGLLVQMTSGAAVGRTRRIEAASGVTASTLNRAWATAEGIPATGDSYRLLCDLRWLKHLHVKAEYSANNITATILALLYDYPYTAAGAARASIAMPDQLVDLSNLTIQGETQEASYYHASPYPLEAKGHLGAKIKLQTLTGGNVSLWVAGT